MPDQDHLEPTTFKNEDFTMIKKTLLGLATALSLGLSAVAISTPAQAGFWLDGAYVESDRGWEHHHCHWEWRTVRVWHHGFARDERQQVRVCFHH
jgi:hypothetical protein